MMRDIARDNFRAEYPDIPAYKKQVFPLLQLLDSTQFKRAEHIPALIEDYGPEKHQVNFSMYTARRFDEGERNEM